ncbi:hypothetical protein Q0F98_37090 [Paenibacillus amylolyticus]|nr:hypothetical protein Q0F98_37090 [Paenibacillus amylolyticus]
MMKKRQGQLHLGAFIYFTGHHHAGWRHPESGVEKMFDIDWYKRLPRQLRKASLI